MQIAQGVSVDPDVQSGEPCITGQRWPTRVVRSYVRAGADLADIQLEYPFLTDYQLACAMAWEFRPKKMRDEIVKAALKAKDQPHDH